MRDVPEDAIRLPDGRTVDADECTWRALPREPGTEVAVIKLGDDSYVLVRRPRRMPN